MEQEVAIWKGLGMAMTTIPDLTSGNANSSDTLVIFCRYLGAKQKDCAAQSTNAQARRWKEWEGPRKGSRHFKKLVPLQSRLIHREHVPGRFGLIHS